MKKLLIGLLALWSISTFAGSYKCTVNTGKTSEPRDSIIVSNVKIEANGKKHKIAMLGSKMKGVIISLKLETEGYYKGYIVANATLKKHLNDGVSVNVGSDIAIQTLGLPGSILSAGTFDFKSDLMYNIFCVPKI